GNGKGQVQTWDVQTGAHQLTMTVNGPANWVTCVAFSPDGKYLASSTRVNGAPEDPGEVQVWDAQTGEEVLTFRGHTAFVASVAFSPDGRLLLSAGGDRTWKVLDLPAVRPPQMVGGKLSRLWHSGPVTRLAFSPDGKCFAGSSWDTTVKVWDAQTGAE